MQFENLVASRYSCRAFSQKEVEREKLERILESGRLSPSAVNAQPVKIIVLKSQQSLNKIREITRMVYNAPLVLMVCYDESKCYTAEKYNDSFCSGIMDSSIIATTMMLQATELGLSTLFARGFNASYIESAFGLEENIKVACLLDVGYADENEGIPSSRHFERKSMNEFAKEI